MPSSEHRLGPAHGVRLLDLAAASIRCGLERGVPLPVDLPAWPPELRAKRATFVTLERGGALRGCIGRLQRLRPLVEDVAANAFAAAFRDDRFPPVTAPELEDLTIKLSLLSRPMEMAFVSEDDLLAQLVPGRDGLILEAGWTHATFLPSVWESLPAPADFLRHLKLKAGLPGRGLPPGLKAFRYSTEAIP